MKLVDPHALGLLTPPAPRAETPKQCKPSVSSRQAHEVLLHRLLQGIRAFGHLRAVEVAPMLYPRAKHGRQLASRLLRVAATRGLCVPRRNAMGGLSYVLGDKGVAALELQGLAARHGRDIVGVCGPTFAHRTLTTQYLARQGGGAFGEYAIAHGLAPVTRETLGHRFRKWPDGLVCRSDERGLTVDVIECEQSAKPMRELMRVLSWAEVVGTTLAGEGTPRVARLVVVFDAHQQHARRILAAARERWGHCMAGEQLAAMRRVVLCGAELGPGFVWQGCEERSLASMAMGER